jgi:hypothetical protein
VSIDCLSEFVDGFTQRFLVVRDVNGPDAAVRLLAEHSVALRAVSNFAVIDDEPALEAFAGTKT